jgi:O-antigen/teichoic acid export membrane protein
MFFSNIRDNGQLLRQLSWAAFGQIASAMGLIVGIRLLTEFVPPAVYGNVSILLGIGAFCYTIFHAPLFHASLRFYSDAQKRGQVGLLRLTIFELAHKILFPVTILFVLGGLFYSFYAGTSWWFGVLLAAILIVDVYKNLETGLLNAARRQRECALWNVAETWGRPICAIILVSCFQASAGLILFGYLCASLPIYCYFRLTGKLEGGEEPVTGSDRRNVLLKEIYRYALPLVPSALVGGIYSLSDRYIVGGFLGLEQLGIFAAVSGLMSRPFIIMCGIIEQSLRPVYFERVVAENGSGEGILRRWLMLATLICAAGFFLVVSLRSQVVNILLAPKYRSSVDLIPWLATGYACYAISFIYENVFHAYNKTVAMLKINIAMAIVMVVVTMLLTYNYRVLGAAVSVTIVYMLRLIILRYSANRIIKYAHPL